MKTNQEKYQIIIPKGYDVEDICETDDSDFDEDPFIEEEVDIIFERNQTNEL